VDTRRIPPAGDPIYAAGMRNEAGSPREERGLALFRERSEEIRHLRGQAWSVPSCTRPGVYVVDLASGICTCADTPPAGEVCKHVTAATVARAKSAVCSGCSVRSRRREMVELHEDNHDNLTYFHGDRLCRRCADGAGIEY
jgi:hypothetical protein